MKKQTSEAEVLTNLAAFTLAMAILAALAMCLSGCGSVKVSGNTKHEVGGEATIKLAVDFKVCDALPEADRAACVQTLLDLLNKSKKSNPK